MTQFADRTIWTGDNLDILRNHRASRSHAKRRAALRTSPATPP